MPSVRRLAGVIAFVVTAAPVAAQSAGSLAGPQAFDVSGAVAPPASAVRAAEVAVSLAPTIESLAVGVRAVPVRPAPVLLPRRGDTSRNRALMIVGGATLLVGAIIGGNPGTIIMIGGGVIGIYGLYKYLQ